MTLKELALQVQSDESKRICLVANTAHLIAIIRSKHGHEMANKVERITYLVKSEQTDTARHKLWAELETVIQNYQAEQASVLMPGMSTVPRMMPGM